MTQRSWNVEDDLPEEDSDARQYALTIVTLHYVRGAVRRRWAICAAAAFLGAILGVAFAFLVPAQSQGTVTLLLTHDVGSDPATGMATDISLLRTRAVADATVKHLGIEMTPEAFHRSVQVVPSTSNVLVLTVAGMDDADATNRSRVLAEEYLAFRREQLMSQAEAMVDGYQSQVDTMQDQVDALTKRYNTLTATGPVASAEAGAVLTERSQRSSEVVRLQQMIEDTTLKTSAVVSASHVLDPASAVPRAGLVRTALAAGSGFVGGGSLALGVVVFLAITSDRLRRREEIGLALGVPVRASVASLAPRRFLRRRTGAPQPPGLQVLLHVLDGVVVRADGPSRKIGLVATDDGSDAHILTANLAVRMARRGLAVFVADLSAAGSVSALVQAEARDTAGEDMGTPPYVFRPEGPPQLALGWLRLPVGTTGDLRAAGAHRQAFDAADVVVALAEVEPELEADFMATWVDSVVYVVRAGRSSAERLRTVAQLVGSAGLRAECALLVGSDGSDESLGIPEPAVPPPAIWRAR